LRSKARFRCGRRYFKAEDVVFAVRRAGSWAWGLGGGEGVFNGPDGTIGTFTDQRGGVISDGGGVGFAIDNEGTIGAWSNAGKIIGIVNDPLIGRTRLEPPSSR
jgi:hypothetical protein